MTENYFHFYTVFTILYDLFQPRRLSYSRHTIKEDPRTEKNYKLHMQVRRMMSENKDLRKRQKVQPTGNSSRTDAHEVNLLILLFHIFAFDFERLYDLVNFLLLKYFFFFADSFDIQTRRTTCSWNLKNIAR